MWVCSAGEEWTRSANHAPALVVSGVKTSETTASTTVSQTSRWRAAGQNAQKITKIVVSGTRTIRKWFSKMWAGSP